MAGMRALLAVLPCMVASQPTELVAFRANGEPKSGTTWYEFILSAMLKTACSRDPACTYTATRGRVYSAVQGGRAIRVDVGRKHEFAGINRHKRGGFSFATPPNLTDDELAAKARQTWQKENKFELPIFRDPRAVVVSECHHRGQHDCNAYALQYIHVRSAWVALRFRFFEALRHMTDEGSGRALAHIVFYEDLKAYFAKVLIKLSTYVLGYPLTDKDIAAVHNATLPASMRKQLKQGKIRGVEAGRVRKAQTCGFETELREEVVQAITKEMDAVLPSELSEFWQCGRLR